MPFEDLTNYESWQMDIPKLTKRSFLYSLQPIGLNTPCIESFTSYLNRLANAHGFSGNDLIQYKIMPLFVIYNYSCLQSFEDETIRLAIRAFYSESTLFDKQSAEFWLDKTQHVSTVVEVVEKLTECSNLSCLTLLPMRSWHLNLSHIFHDSQRWCAGCYQDCKEAGLPVYNSLLWALSPVSVCPYHQRYLQLRCLRCGSSQTFLKQDNKPIGYCCLCGSWLGRFVDPPIALRGHQFDWYLWLAQAIGKILAAMPQKSQLTVKPRDPIFVFNQKPTLSAFLSRCYKLKMNPVDGLELLGILPSTAV